MGEPAPPRASTAAKLTPIIGGFLLFGAIAAFDERLALIAAVGMIGFAAISMLLAIIRKH